MKRLVLSLFTVMTVMIALGQNAVSWTFRLVGDGTENPRVEATATIAPGLPI